MSLPLHASHFGILGKSRLYQPITKDGELRGAAQTAKPSRRPVKSAIVSVAGGAVGRCSREPLPPRVRPSGFASACTRPLETASRPRRTDAAGPNKRRPPAAPARSERRGAAPRRARGTCACARRRGRRRRPGSARSAHPRWSEMVRSGPRWSEAGRAWQCLQWLVCCVKWSKSASRL